METQEISKTGRQVLTFSLAGELFAYNIKQIREVLDYVKVTSVPQTPDFMRGVINLRGKALPVIDLRLKFGMDGLDDLKNTSIVVVEVNIDDEIIQLGALADSVHEVVEFEGSEIETVPKIGVNLNTDFIEGMAKKEEQFVMILDINRCFTTEELDMLKYTQEKSE